MGTYKTHATLKIILLASCMMIGPLQSSYAQTEMPEIEIDGSVYQSLSAKHQRELNAPAAAKPKKQFAPVVLRPPKDPAPDMKSAATLTSPDDDAPFNPSLIEPAAGEPTPLAPLAPLAAAPVKNRPMLSEPDFAGDAVMERDIAELPVPKMTAPKITAPAVVDVVAAQPPVQPLAKPSFATASKTITPGTVSRAVDVPVSPTGEARPRAKIAPATPTAPVMTPLATTVQTDLTVPPIMSRPVAPVEKMTIEKATIEKVAVAAPSPTPTPTPVATTPQPKTLTPKSDRRTLSQLMTDPVYAPAAPAVTAITTPDVEEVPLEPIALLKQQPREPQPALVAPDDAMAPILQPVKPVILAPAPDPEPVAALAAPLPRKKNNAPRNETIVYQTPPAATTAPVNFGISSTVIQSSGLTPPNVKTQTISPSAPIAAAQANLPVAPAPTKIIEAKIIEAKPVLEKAQPEKLTKAVPIPPQRPEKNLASEDFVREARDRALVTSYTGMERDSDAMKPVARKAAAKDKLPAQRMSVADIAGDPLASQIVDLSPQEIAQALNNIAPAAGVAMSNEVHRVSKPRIVREMGEWNRKSKTIKASTADITDNTPQATTTSSAAASANAESAVAAIPPVMAALPENLVFRFTPGKIEMDAAESAKIDDSVIAALKASENTRIQIVAFASAPDGKEGTARRTSLSRALAIRSLLVAKGIEATRMDVRALGLNPDQTAEQDKVNMILVPAKKS